MSFMNRSGGRAIRRREIYGEKNQSLIQIDTQEPFVFTPCFNGQGVAGKLHAPSIDDAVREYFGDQISKISRYNSQLLVTLTNGHKYNVKRRSNYV